MLLFIGRVAMLADYERRARVAGQVPIDNVRERLTRRGRTRTRDR